VILALVDVAAGGEQAQPLPDYIYLRSGIWTQCINGQVSWAVFR